MENDEGKQPYSVYLLTAAKLYRIGAAIEYYNFAKHTFYLIVHSHLNGLSHKEILLVAAIASYRSKSKARAELKSYGLLISNDELELIYRLGTLLQLAIALDRSETHSIDSLELKIEAEKLYITAKASSDLQLEALKVAEIASDFKKQWGVKPVLKLVTSVN